MAEKKQVTVVATLEVNDEGLQAIQGAVDGLEGAHAQLTVTTSSRPLPSGPRDAMGGPRCDEPATLSDLQILR